MAPEREPELKWKTRISPRARYPRLQVKPFGGLEVVIPPRFPREEIPWLVQKHAGWARRQLDRQRSLRDAVKLPRRLDLAFDGSSTPVVYGAESLSVNYDLFAAAPGPAIVVEAESRQRQIGELRAWIRARAKRLLPPLLREMSARTGLGFARAGVRSQKTRWGSCSARGHISLNDQLLFLPRDAVEYLMIHELCHTRHLNHSRAFWALVEKHCPGYRAHEELLSRPRGLVPDWFLLDLYA